MNKVILTTLSLVILSVFSLQARKLNVDVDSSHDLMWSATETPSLKFCLWDEDTKAVIEPTQVSVRVTKDVDESQNIFKVTYPMTVVPGQQVQFEIELLGLTPGFYKVFVDDNGKTFKKFNIGYEPTMVYSLPDAKDDFNQFWTQALTELEATPMNLSIEEIPSESGLKRKMYLVNFTSWGGDKLTAKVAIPSRPGKYPVKIRYNGYGTHPDTYDADANPDWIEMWTSVRGQFFNEGDNKYGDWIQYHISDPKTYYYRGAFMDAIRAIDVAEYLPFADPTLIFVEGVSQGGALALVAAALDSRPVAIASAVPFLNDFRDYFKIVDWPATPAKEAAKAQGITEEQMYDNLSYFDVKNMARRIKCPVLMSIGLQDTTTPPHTNMASYTLINSPKELKIYPLHGHQIDFDDWYTRRMDFFQRFLPRRDVR